MASLSYHRVDGFWPLSLINGTHHISEWSHAPDTCISWQKNTAARLLSNTLPPPLPPLHRVQHKGRLGAPMTGRRVTSPGCEQHVLWPPRFTGAGRELPAWGHRAVTELACGKGRGSRASFSFPSTVFNEVLSNLCWDRITRHHYFLGIKHSRNTRVLNSGAWSEIPTEAVVSYIQHDVI